MDFKSFITSFEKLKKQLKEDRESKLKIKKQNQLYKIEKLKKPKFNELKTITKFFKLGRKDNVKDCLLLLDKVWLSHKFENVLVLT